MDLNSLLRLLTTNGQMLGIGALLLIVGYAAYLNWDKVKTWLPGGGSKVAPSTERVAAFNAVNLLIAYYESEQCAEGLKAARECGEHLFHVHATPAPTATPAIGPVANPQSTVGG